MGQSYSEDTGFRIEAFRPDETVPDRRPMLYSAEALKTIESIREQLGRVLKQEALGMARGDGRTLVSDDDVWEALEHLGMMGIYADSDQGAGDGG